VRLNAIMGAAVAFLVEDAKMLKTLFFPPGVLALVAAVAGCGSDDRPATSDSIVTSRTELGTQPAPPPGEPGMPAHVCVPRSYRECTITYVDEDGQLQCPVNAQICNAEGTAWLACGVPAD
jgi:hypothetical protein